MDTASRYGGVTMGWTGVESHLETRTTTQEFDA